MTMNRLQCDIQLRGCQLGHMFPERCGPRRRTSSAVPTSQRGSLAFGQRTKRGWHHEDRHGCQPARRGDALDPWRLTAGPRRPYTSVLTTRTLQGAVLDLAVVPSVSKPRVVVSALVLSNDRVGVHWVVVDNASLALHAALSWSYPPLRGVALDTCHLTWPRNTFQRAPGCSVGQQVQRVLPFGLPRRGRA